MNQTEKDALIQIFVSQEPYNNTVLDASKAGELIMNTDTDEIVDIIISNNAKRIPVNSKSIPQFSSIDDIPRILQIIADSGIDDLDYAKLGSFLCGKGATEGAKRKYGENHIKLAAQLGFATMEDKFEITELGMYFYYLSEDDKKIFLSKIALRISAVQEALIKAQNNSVNVQELLESYIAASTAKRRGSNINGLLKRIRLVAGPKTMALLSKIY